MADPESTIPNDTSDLEKLLQEALEDFGRPVLLPSEKERVRLESTAATTGECSVDDAAHSKDGFPSTSSPASSNGKHKAKTTTDAAAEDAFLAETEKEIDNVLAAIAQESPALAQQLRSLTDCAGKFSRIYSAFFVQLYGDIRSKRTKRKDSIVANWAEKLETRSSLPCWHLWSIDWLIDWSIHWYMDWLIDWLVTFLKLHSPPQLESTVPTKKKQWKHSLNSLQCSKKH